MARVICNLGNNGELVKIFALHQLKEDKKKKDSILHKQWFVFQIREENLNSNIKLNCTDVLNFLL